MTKAELIQHNAKRICDLHDAVHSAYRRKRENDSAEEQWR